MRGAAGVAFLLACTPAFTQDSLGSIGDRRYLTEPLSGGKITLIRYPVLGCPEIVKTGNLARAILKTDTVADAQVFIVATGDTYPVERTLPVTGSSWDTLTQTTTLEFQIPQDVPPDTYDLRIKLADREDRQPNCLRVIAQETSTFSFVVLSDTHFSDPRGRVSPGNGNPGKFDSGSIVGQIKQELRLLNPTFALICGDITFGVDYQKEYDGAWNQWKDTGVPLFMVPGNHDGYAATKDRTVFGTGAKARDGLDDWRRFIGPTYFSFDFGGTHFQGVNSYDGTTVRRDGFLVVVENWGGDLSPEQMTWIASDLSGRTNVIPWMHHSPLGPYKENGTFRMRWFAFAKIFDFLSGGNGDSFGQTWNSQATGDFLKAQYQGRTQIVFSGHEHYDDYQLYGGTVYKTVTSTSSSTDDYWGYAFIQVQDGTVSDYLYAGAANQSVPAGNLSATVYGYDATIRSGLSRPYDLTLEFLVPAAAGFEATGGEVIGFADVGDGQSRVWVRATAPTSPSTLQPASENVTLKATAGVEAASTTLTGGGGGGGGCSSSAPPSGPAGALPYLAVLAILILLRSRRA